MNDVSTLAAKVAAIQKMTTKELMNLWPKLYGSEAPKLNRLLLIQRLAFRVQELELGGLTDRHKAQLKRLQKSSAKNTPLPTAKINKPPIGTKLVKEYEGETHEVFVIKEGFEYRGQIYRSLSKIARQITGSHWSGPMFFGLKNKRN